VAPGEKRGQRRSTEAEAGPLAESPEAWHNTALGLMHSSDVIWTRWLERLSRLRGGKSRAFAPDEGADIVYLLPASYLLRGLAIENLLKGLLVARDPSQVRRAIRWNVSRGGHDLVQLSRLAGLDIDEDEQRVLDALTEAVIWAGRYPVPRNHEGLPGFGIPTGMRPGKLDTSNIITKLDEPSRITSCLFQRIERLYPPVTRTPGANDG
jgi:hypothetical protein